MFTWGKSVDLSIGWWSSPPPYSGAVEMLHSGNLNFKQYGHGVEMMCSTRYSTILANEESVHEGNFIFAVGGKGYRGFKIDECTEIDRLNCGPFGRFDQYTFIPNDDIHLSNGLVKDLQCGERHVFILADDGKLFGFGESGNGQLGYGGSVMYVWEAFIINKHDVGTGFHEENVLMIGTGNMHSIAFCTHPDTGNGIYAFYGTGTNDDYKAGLENNVFYSDFNRFFDDGLLINEILSGNELKKIELCDYYTYYLFEDGKIFGHGSLSGATPSIFDDKFDENPILVNFTAQHSNGIYSDIQGTHLPYYIRCVVRYCLLAAYDTLDDYKTVIFTWGVNVTGENMNIGRPIPDGGVVPKFLDVRNFPDANYTVTFFQSYGESENLVIVLNDGEYIFASGVDGTVYSEIPDNQEYIVLTKFARYGAENTNIPVEILDGSIPGRRNMIFNSGEYPPSGVLTAVATTCGGIDSWDIDNVCNGHGECSIQDECTCDDDWRYGVIEDYCGVTLCYGVLSRMDQVCNARGKCNSINNCTCNDGYYSDDCSLCDGENFCNGHSTYCGNNNGDITCVCEDGYIGDKCEIRTCFSISENDTDVCNSRGKCNIVNNCTCDDGFNHVDCSLCDGDKICNGRSTYCGNNNGDITCVCKEGYIGDNCEIITCFSISENYTDVCSGNGRCTDANICNCTDSFEGKNCQIPKCNGLTDVKGACTSRGSCVEPNKCLCDGSWDPETFCEFPLCFDNPVDTACNGFLCTAPDTCICNVTNDNGNGEGIIVKGKNCESKIGKNFIRSKIDLLVMHFELKVSELQNIYNLHPFEEFDCSRIIYHKSDSLLERGIISCFFSSTLEMSESDEFVYFLNVIIDPQVFDFLKVNIHYNGLDDVLSNKIISLNIDPSIRKRDFTLYPYKGGLIGTDNEQPEQSTCKDVLKLDENCYELFKCYLEDTFYGSNGKKNPSKWIQIGYIPKIESSKSSKFFQFGKFYYKSEEECKSNRTKKYVSFFTATCFGSSFGDNFVVYEKCTGSFLSDQATVQQLLTFFSISVIPLLVLAFVIFTLIIFCFFGFGVMCFGKKKKSNVNSIDDNVENEKKKYINEVIELGKDNANYKKPSIVNIVLCSLPQSIFSSILVIISFLLSEGIYIYLATSEFLSNDDVDSSNEKFIVIQGSLDINNYIITFSFVAYLISLFLIIIIFCIKYMIDPFFLCMVIGALKEWIVFRIVKSVFLCWFLCFNLYCAVVKFSFMTPTEQAQVFEFSTFTFQILSSVIVPELLLLMELSSVLNYNGVSSHSYVKFLDLISFKNLILFPKIKIGFLKAILKSVDEIMEDFLQVISIINDKNDIKLKENSDEFGHLAWEMVNNFNDDEIKKYKLILNPRVLQKQNIENIIKYNKVLSLRWIYAVLSYPFVMVKKYIVRERSKIIPVENEDPDVKIHVQKEKQLESATPTMVEDMIENKKEELKTQNIEEYKK